MLVNARLKEQLFPVPTLSRTFIYDWYLAFKAVENHGIYYIDKTINQYRIHTNSVTNTDAYSPLKEKCFREKLMYIEDLRIEAIKNRLNRIEVFKTFLKDQVAVEEYATYLKEKCFREKLMYIEDLRIEAIKNRLNRIEVFKTFLKDQVAVEEYATYIDSLKKTRFINYIEDLRIEAIKNRLNRIEVFKTFLKDQVAVEEYATYIDSLKKTRFINFHFVNFFKYMKIRTLHYQIIFFIILHLPFLYRVFIMKYVNEGRRIYED